ncbi:tetratricopeptide repeat protein [bacterium]|nr:tetratricopeptide repeat protein [bacterium]
MKKIHVNSLKPSQEQLNSLLECYQSGRLDDAEKLSLFITQEFPKHQFGWKVLGATLKQMGKINESLVASEKSVQLNPQDTEAHNNLGNILKELGRLKEAETSYKKAIKLKPDLVEAHYNLGNTLKELGKLDEAEASYKKTITLKPDLAEAHYNLGNILKELGRLKEAEASYKKAIILKPDYVKAHNNLGNAIKELGKLDEAEVSYRQAITLKPDYADAHNNLSVLLQELGKLDEAEASLRQAITLKPDYADAHNNLGNTLKELGKLDEAEKSYKKAIALKPDYAEAHNNLGILLKEFGRLDEACSAYIQAINLNPDFTYAYNNLGIAIKNVRFNSSNVKLYPVLIRLLSTGNFVRPLDLAPSILSLLKHDPLIKNLLLEENFPTRIKEANSIIVSLDKLTLLHHLMRVCLIPDLQFEGFFVTMRNLLLTNLDNFESSSELIYFLSTLSLHCFTNEYVYVEKDRETELVENLETEIMQTITKSEQPEAKKILCLASYRPLHQYNWCEKLKALDHLEEVKSRLIEEPYAERAIRTEIPILEEISNDVSRKVRAQYEENPFPRWVKLGIPTKAKSISEIFAELNLHLHSKSIKNVITPAILIAGCGTGQHSIVTASRFSDCQVTAVDLSLDSLAYAKRKTAELGITNLEYLQADILRLDQLEQQFDIIESVGVLHHMDEPMAGWRVLTNLLKPNGLMQIGLYSEMARHHIVKVRKEITLKKVGTSQSEIRKFRQALVESNDKNHQQFTNWNDFFSLSMVRDLIFHVQEHRFTLPQIKNCLNELKLKFCGFENQVTISNFRKFHGEEADIYDLALWHQYEESNPQAFIGMYQFWCQKL